MLSDVDVTIAGGKSPDDVETSNPPDIEITFTGLTGDVPLLSVVSTTGTGPDGRKTVQVRHPPLLSPAGGAAAVLRGYGGCISFTIGERVKGAAWVLFGLATKTRPHPIPSRAPASASAVESALEAVELATRW